MKLWLTDEGIDRAKLDQVIAIQWAKAEGVKAKNKPKSQALFYSLMANYFQNTKNASESGDAWVLHTTSVPVEVFTSMGLPSILGPLSSSSILRSLKLQPECFQAADEIGLNYGICNGHRSQVGIFLRGWFPRPSCVINLNGSQCDNVAKTLGIVAYVYNVPEFFLDVPYFYSDRGVAYLANEIKKMIHFLEEVTHHRMDWAKLEEACHISNRMARLSSEIGRLAHRVPCPMDSRSGGQQYLIHWMYAGQPEGLKFFEALRDEVRARADQGIGVHPNEKHRLMSVFLPHGNPRILDWMRQEKGAVVVSEPYYFCWKDEELDPSKPLEFLARRMYNDPLHLFAGGRVFEDRLLDRLVQEAKDSKAHGAIDWANIAGCRNHCSLGRPIREALKEKAGIPVGLVDVDLNDQSQAGEDLAKEKLETFFELLESWTK